MLRPNTGEVAPHGVELRQLCYFGAVAEAGTFTQAAERTIIARAQSDARASGWRSVG
jgi:hypothetical protein